MEQKQQLDVDRQLRDLDLQREEVALETQYYQLGDSVQSLPPDEYDQQLDALEKRRFALEEQRRQFEGEFKERENAIDAEISNAAEAATRADAEAAAAAAASPTAAGRPRASSAAKQQRDAQTRQRQALERQERKERERGWNSNTQKRTTQNRALRRKRNPTLPSEYRQQATMTAGGASPGMDASIGEVGAPPSPLAAPMTPPGAAPVSVPTGPDTQELQAAIAAEERRLMAIEEERKWREYEAAVAGAVVADAPVDMAAAPSHAPGSDYIEVEQPRNAAEQREATEWLKVPRKLALKERNSESEMVFSVVEDHDGFKLQWSTPTAPTEIEGFALLADVAQVKAVASDTTLFSVVLRGHNPQAVRNSGGLHAVNVRASSPSECAMYRSGLIGLHHMVNSGQQ